MSLDNGDLKMQSTQKFIKDFRCPVCLKTYDGSIFQCSSGHSGCEGCKMKMCLCGSLFTGVRNYALEGLMKHIVRPCSNKSEGCNVTLTFNKNSELQDHLKNCPFRNVVCTEVANTMCQRKEVPYGKFIEHLQKVHGSSEIETFSLTKEDLNIKEGLVFVTSTFQYLDRWFLVKLWMYKEHVSISVLFFGTTTDAKKYKGRLLIGDADIKKKHRYWDIPQLTSFRERETNPDYCTVSLSKKKFIDYRIEGNIKDKGNPCMVFSIKCFIELTNQK